jgi:anthranilate synthase/aminodeoxychorismate synthase-like glutamine amidotransferase
MILLVDNYDSFTYNLYQYLCELGAAVEVRRNDEVDVADVAKMQPDSLVISPGPCTPNEAGNSNALIAAYSGKLPILGVCLGLQCIGQVFGGQIVRAAAPMHGKTSLIHHDGNGLFAGLPNPFVATRYHSLVIEPRTAPVTLQVTAWADDDTIQAVQHKQHRGTVGVQFHPESILTEHGKGILRNFLEGRFD